MVLVLGKVEDLLELLTLQVGIVLGLQTGKVLLCERGRDEKLASQNRLGVGKALGLVCVQAQCQRQEHEDVEEQLVEDGEYGP